MYRAVEFSSAAKERIAQAAAFEKRLRLEAFLGVKSEVGPWKFRPLTPRDVLQLEYTENALFCGSMSPAVDDYAMVVFMLADRNGMPDRKLAADAARRLTADESLRAEVSAYIVAQYNDMPAVGGAAKRVDPFDSNVDLANIVDLIAAEYGWDLDRILDTPLAVLLQLSQRVIARRVDKYKIRSGITQAAKARELNAMNNG